MTEKRDSNRLALHLMPPQGWLNDPNGLCQIQGVYHVFYQYAPLDANGASTKMWGHYTSKDLIKWKEYPAALLPDQDFDRDGVYSGSALAEDGKMYLYYTGNVKHCTQGDLTYSGREANTVLVTSEDGVHFSEKQVVLTSADYPETYTCHVRDPKVWKENGRCYMIQGGRKKKYPESGAEANSAATDYGAVLLFESEDREHWHYHGERTTAKRFGYMWECPDYFEVDQKPVLSISPQGLAAETYRYQNVYQSGYFLLGQPILESEKMPDEQTFREWDMGFDFYAPQTFEDEKGRRILIGWAGICDADYDNQPTVDCGWQHALTLLREITFVDGKLLQNPVKEYEALRKEKIGLKTAEKENKVSLESPVFELELKPEKRQECFFEIKNHDQMFRFCFQEGIAEISLTEKAGRGRKSRKARIADLKKIRLIADTSLAEIYLNDGETVITSRMYFEDEDRSLTFAGMENAALWYLRGLEAERV